MSLHTKGSIERATLLMQGNVVHPNSSTHSPFMTDCTLPSSSPGRARYQQQQEEARLVVKLRGAALLQAEQQARNKLAVEAPAVLGKFEAEARQKIAAAVRASTVSAVLPCPHSASAPVPCSTSCACSTNCACSTSVCGTSTACLRSATAVCSTNLGSTCNTVTGSITRTINGRRKPSMSAIRPLPDTGHSTSQSCSCPCARNTSQRTQQLQQQCASAAAGSHHCSGNVIQQLAPTGTGLGPLAGKPAWQGSSCSGCCCSCSGCHSQLAGQRPQSAPASAKETGEVSTASLASNQDQQQQLPAPRDTQLQLPQSGGCNREATAAAAAVASRHQLLQQSGESVAPSRHLPQPPALHQRIAQNVDDSSCFWQARNIRYLCNTEAHTDIGGSSTGSMVQRRSRKPNFHEPQSKAADDLDEGGLLQPLLGQCTDSKAVMLLVQKAERAVKSAEVGTLASSTADGSSKLASYHVQSGFASCWSADDSQNAAQAARALPMSEAGTCSSSSSSPRQCRSPIAQAIASCHAAAIGAVHRAVASDRMDPMREPLLLYQ